MKNKLWYVLGLIFTLILSTGMIASCGTASDEPADKGESSTIEITDYMQRMVAIKKYPEKIVSLAPSNTEVLFALGLDEKIVGVSDYCDYPAAALDKPKIGGYSNSDVERIVALEPDLVLIEEFHTHEILPALEQLGLTVVTIDPRNLDQVLDSIELIGKITGTDDRASQIVKDMSSRIEAVREKTSGLTDEQRLRVFYVMWHDPLMTIGSGTLIQEMIEIAGGVNIFSNLDGYPTISLETLVEANPQVLIAGTGMGEGADAPFTFLKTEERLANTDARANNRVFEISTDLTGRPTERMIDGLELLAKMIHPELFK